MRIVEWLRGTGLTPFLKPLTGEEQAAFLAAYKQELAKAYTPLPMARLYCRFRACLSSQRDSLDAAQWMPLASTIGPLRQNQGHCPWLQAVEHWAMPDRNWATGVWVIEISQLASAIKPAVIAAAARYQARE